MFEQFSRSWTLVKASAGVLKQDKELLVFPAISVIASLLVVATFILPLFGLLDCKALEQGEREPVWLYAWVFLFYLAQYFVIFYFNTALVGAAMIRLRGGDPTVADGLQIAWSKVGTILGYALIAATVGMILRAIEERAGMIGKWVAGLLGAAWTVLTFLTVPVLVSRDIGPLEAVKESALLLKKTWGENVIGQGGVGLVFGLLQFVVITLTVVALIALVVASKSMFLIVSVIVLGVSHDYGAGAGSGGACPASTRRRCIGTRWARTPSASTGHAGFGLRRQALSASAAVVGAEALFAIQRLVCRLDGVGAEARGLVARQRLQLVAHLEFIAAVQPDLVLHRYRDVALGGACAEVLAVSDLDFAAAGIRLHPGATRGEQRQRQREQDRQTHGQLLGVNAPRA